MTHLSTSRQDPHEAAAPKPLRWHTASLICGWGSFAAIALGLLLHWLHRVGETNVCRTGVLLLYVGAPLLALAGAAMGGVAVRSGKRTGLKVSLMGFVCVLLLFLLHPSSDIHACYRRIDANETHAIGSLRSLHSAVASYHQRFGTLPPSLQSLGPGDQPTGQGTSARDPQHADLIDNVLASGLKLGYEFTYLRGTAEAASAQFRYTILARPVTPGVVGERSFFTDETGVIRFTRDDRAATKDDTPVR